MQKLTIAKVQSYSYDENLVLLIDKESDLKGLDLTSQETDFVKKELHNKSAQVMLNRYTNWVIIQTADLSKEGPQLKESLRKGGCTLCQLLQKQKATKIIIADTLDKPELTLAFVEGLALANYQFIKYQKDAEEKASALKELHIASEGVTENDIQKLSSVVEAVYAARDLINEPASVITAVRLSEEIAELGKEAGFSVEVLDKAKIQALKMGGLLAVNQGSTQPPTFTILEWKPENAVNASPVVLVGKGLVYDTGGYSLKPTTNSMDYMKSDMSGAAAVAATFYALAKTKLPVHVVGLIPSTDNQLSPDAYSPGDIITISDGTTVEVLNTDAEGRLILADALVYAQKYNPELVFTIATLTGAAHSAIGELGTVGMGNVSEDIEKKITEAGNDVYERVAVFPFWEEYADMLNSDIADLKNVGGGLAGAITAGKFLEHFTNYPYFHLDIAGPAFLKKPNSYRGLGATGTGVRLFYRFLELLDK